MIVHFILLLLKFNIVKSYQTEWRTVFIIIAVIYFIGGTQSLFLTSGELQSWAKNTPKMIRIKRKSFKLDTKKTSQISNNDLPSTSNSN